MTSAGREGMKISIALTGSILMGAIAMVLITNEFLPYFMNVIIIPLVSYVIAVVISVIYQYSVCNQLTLSSITIGNLLIPLTNIVVGLILFIEQIPICKYIFGEYDPRNPVSGLKYDRNSAEYVEAISTGDHYKLQLLTNIVKSAVPVYFSNELKKGFVYFYWTLWGTLLPLYFLIGVQGMC